jgi:large subunit ribosomal protein L23
MVTALLHPILTEKSTLLTEKKNQYTFKVESEADKILIKKAVEEKFDVNVVSVRTVNCMGKRKRQFTRKGLIEGKKSNWKKAIVTLKDGQAIDFYTGTGSSSDS